MSTTSTSEYAAEKDTGLVNADVSEDPHLGTTDKSIADVANHEVDTTSEDQQQIPRIWGLTPTEIHDRYWAARGIQVVRCGEQSEIVDDAELFLLMMPNLLTIFELRDPIEQLIWIKPEVLWVRLNDQRDHDYRETALKDDDARFLGFDRDYGAGDSRLARVALTSKPKVARIWRNSSDPRQAWAKLRAQIHPTKRSTASLKALTFDRDSGAESVGFLRHLIKHWNSPNATIDRARQLKPGIWVDRDAKIDPNVEFVNRTWIGAARQLGKDETVVGPTVLWDDPAAKVNSSTVQWKEIEVDKVDLSKLELTSKPSIVTRKFKRLFDIAFSLTFLICTLPIYPLIMLAIWIEDGRPFFFAHRRETLGGKEFPCLKFRSMYNNAEEIKKQLMAEKVNQVDGPQFYMENDPRVTRIGWFMRKTQIDEFPQFINVLLGHMSVVGPRPSPEKENQFCPAWREARLSVRPGITGLWQVKRTREEGKDFQEWIRFDIEYVEKASFFFDIKIILLTIKQLFVKD